MENKNKIIIGLIIFILILLIILGLKVFRSDSNYSNNNTSFINSASINGSTEFNLQNKNEIEKNNKGWTLPLATKMSLAINIIDVIVLLAIIPLLLKKLNVLPVAIIFSIYRILITIILGSNIFVYGILATIITITFVFIYNYLFIFLINKFLLDTNPILYFFGIIILHSILSYIYMLILKAILTIFI